MTEKDTITFSPGNRGSVYGPFVANANVSQRTKEVWRDTPNWDKLSSDMKEMLEQWALKVSRILTGNDPEYLDNLDDVAGYAKIVADRIRESHKAGRFEGATNAG